MARLWSCGFELQSVSAGVEFDTINGSPTISTSTVRSGAAALRCNPSSATTYVQHQVFSGSTVTHIFLRTYLYIASLPNVDTTILAWTDTSTPYEGIQLKTTGQLQFRNSSAASGSLSTALNTGQWYRVELDYNDSSVSAGVANLYLDGTNFATITGLGLNGGRIARVGPMVATTADLYFDDVAVNDNSGTVQTGLAGSGKIVHLHPAAPGDNAQWAQGAGGTANWNRTSEVTPDDATTYNTRTTTGTLTDDFATGNAASGGITAWDSITLVQVGTRAGSTSTTTTGRDIVMRIKSQSGGTVLSSSSFFIATNGWATNGSAIPHIYKLTSYVDPQAGGAWTPNLFDTTQVGYNNNTSSTNAINVSTVWALVEYVQNPIPASVVMGNPAALVRAGSW